MEGEKQVINGLVVSRKKLTQVFLQESFIGLKIIETPSGCEAGQH